MLFRSLRFATRPGASASVENSMSWGEVAVAVREIAGLNRMSPRDVARGCSVAKQWKAKGESDDRILAAIEGVRWMTDRGQTWLDAGEPFGLWAMNGTRTLVDHHSGEKVVRSLYDAGLEASGRIGAPTKAERDGGDLSGMSAEIEAMLQRAAS